VQILCRRTKNNPVLIGEAGVRQDRPSSKGSRSAIGGKATCPRFLAEQGASWPLDLSLIVAGTKVNRGQFERAAQDHHEGADVEKPENVMESSSM